MKLSAVILARAIAFVETFDLAPRGGVFYPDIVPELVKRYEFQKYPQEFKDFDEQKGIEFLEGRSRDTVIQKLVIYANGILVDTRSSTKTSQALIEDALLWAHEKFGLNYQSGVVKRFAYLSQLTFHLDTSLDTLNPALARLASRVSSAVSNIHQDEIQYTTSSILLQHDPLKRKNAIAAFTIFPRTETPFSERKYFSEAPLTTDLHIELLEEFDAGLAHKPALRR